MAKKRGFWAEVNYQTQQAEKRRRLDAAAELRAHAAAQREAERRRLAAERARAAAARADAAEKAAAEKEAARLHVESRLAETDVRDHELAATYAAIDGLLAATLCADDYVDLETLKVTPEHPPFDPGDLAVPSPELPKLVYPPQPVYQEPPAPGPLAGAFGGKKRHQAAVERAQAEHGAVVQQWHEYNQALYAQYLAADEARKQTEEERLRKLADAEALYKEECRQREVNAAARNQELAKLINDLAFDVESAIEEYVGIVLANSVYPDAFPVSHEYEFDLRSRELTLTVTVPQPSDIPTTKEYRYIKARDEITASALPVREQKERYANAVWQVAIRSLHEVFEADRAGKIHSIGLTVGVNRTAPATGLPETVPLAAVAADRETFTQFDLVNIVPQATLEHLGAALSKSPFDLAPADTSHGVRVRGHES